MRYATACAQVSIQRLHAEIAPGDANCGAPAAGSQAA
jgi:hypothetical protein